MTTIDIAYQGDLRTQCLHRDSGAKFLTDAPKDNQGLGREFSPTDLVAAAAGSCSLTLMGIVAKKLQIDIAGTKAEVIKEMQNQPKRKISKLTIKITCPHSFDEEIKKKLVTAVESCPVIHSLSPDVSVNITYVWK